MHTRSVSRNDGRKLGITLTLIFGLLLGWRHLGAEEITVTATGTIARPSPDYLHLFDHELKDGAPFTLVYTFDDSKGSAVPSTCAGKGSGITGSGEKSPGTAVLTINGKSFTFGTGKTRHAETWREVNSECSQSRVIFQVSNIKIPNYTGTSVTLDIKLARTGASFTKDPNWRSDLFTDSVMQDDSASGFTIAGPNMSGDQGFLNIKTVKVKRGG